MSDRDVLIDWCAVSEAREPFTRWIAEHQVSDSDLEEHVRVDLGRGEDGRTSMRILTDPDWAP